MTTTKEMVFIGGVARALRVRGSWTGETHIQKTSYIAKVKYNVPFESDFVLYKHGPYSFDMNKSIGHMLARSLLVADQNPGYGPNFNLNEKLWVVLNSIVGEAFNDYSVIIDSVCDKLAKCNVSELEKIATAVYMNANFPDLSLDERASKINQIKPHIDLDAARTALNYSNSI